jgi:hypothetical protein
MFRTPDLTPAQLVAIVGATIGLVVAAGLDISRDLQDAIINWVSIVAAALLVSDAGIRVGRSLGSAAKAKQDDDTNAG